MGRDELLRLSAWRIRTRQRRRRHLVRAARLEVVATAALPCGHLAPRARAGPTDRGNGRSNARTAADHLRTCLRASDDLTLRSSRHRRPVSRNRSSHLGYNRRRYWHSRRKCRIRLGHRALRTVGAVRSRLTHSCRCRRARTMEQPTGSASQPVNLPVTVTTPVQPTCSLGTGSPDRAAVGATLGAAPANDFTVRWRARTRLLVWHPRCRLAHRPGDRRAAHSWSRMDISTSSYQRPSCSTDSRRRPSSTNPAFS